MSSRNEEAPNKKERRRSTSSRVQLEENVFTTQISHYHQTMGYYSGVSPHFMPDRNCYNNINWSSRAPPWTGWTPPPPATWMTSVSNGGMVSTPQPYHCRIPNRLPPSPFNPPPPPPPPPPMTPQPTPVMDPLLGSMHTPASNNLRGWYARYPNDIPIQDVPMVLPSGQLDNIDCLRHVGNHIRADHNFVEKTLMQKCETTASVCGTTVTRRSWYKMPEKSPPQPTKEKTMIKSNDKAENINTAIETSILPSKVKKMEDAVIMSSDYCSKLSSSNLSSKSSNCLAEVPNHDASSSNFTEYFLKRLMKKHQKESDMKRMPVSDAISSVVQGANILSPSVLPEKHLPHFPVSKNHMRNSHPSKISNRIVEDVIDLSRESPPSLTSESKPAIVAAITPTSHNNTATTTNNINRRKNETAAAAACDLVITNSYSLSFSGAGNKPANAASTKRKLSDTKPSTREDNQKENLIVSDSMSDYQMKLTDGRSKRKKYEPRKRDSFIIEDDPPCWVSGNMNKLIDTNFHSNDKNALTNNIIEKPNDHENKCMNKMDGGDNAPEYCDIVDILHSLSESGPNSQRVGHASKNDSLLERKVIKTTNSIRNDSKCITLDDTDDSDSPQSGETITPCTVIRSRQSLDTLSTEENSVDSIHDSTLSSSSFDNNDALEDRILEKNLRFSPLSEKEYSKNEDNLSLNSSEKSSSMSKGNIYFAEKEKVGKEKETSSETGSTKESTKSTWMTLSVSKPSICTIPGKIPTLTICKIPKAMSILPIKKQPVEQRISDEELETLEVLEQNTHAKNVAVASPTSCPKKEEQSQDDSLNRDKPGNVITVEAEKRLSENATPIKVWDSSENPISIVNDGLENSEEAPFVGNESDDCLPSGRPLSETPLPEGIGSYRKIADEDAHETTAAAASKVTHIDPSEAEDPRLTKETLDPAPKVNSVDTSESNSQSNSLNDNEQMDQDTSPSNAMNSIEIITCQAVPNLENQKQPVVESHRQEDDSFERSILHIEPVTKSLFPKNSNIFTLTTSPLKSKSTASLTNCNEMVPAGAATLQQAALEVLNHSKKVLSCNNLKEINQSPCVEFSENGDMKVIAIVTDYEESACDNLLGLAGPESELCKNSNIIITAIDSPKKDAVLEYSEHPSDPPFQEFHKSKMPNLTDYEKCKNSKENRSLFNSFLNCHKEKDVFSTTCNGNIVILKESAAKTKELPTFSSDEIQNHDIEDQVVHLEHANSTVDLNLMSVELKQLSPTVEYSANKLELSLVSNFVVDKSKPVPAIDNYLPKRQWKTLKRKKKKIKSKNKTKGKFNLKKFKKRKISDKNHKSPKLYRQFKKKFISPGMKTDSDEFRDSLVTCREQYMGQTTAAIENNKVQLQLASKTHLEKYDLSSLRARISISCPNRRGRIFRSPQESNLQVQDDTADCVSSLNKQCQTDNPFYGCLSHAFKGSCYQPAERRPPSSIIHKFVKFHGHKLLCVIINVKKYVIVRELVRKCFQGNNQVVFYRTKYRDYSFPYLELPFHMKSFVLKYLLESGNLLTGNSTTPLSIMLVSDAEIIYHFFYSFRECSLTACVQDWNSDDTGVYDPDWLKILETTSAVSMKMEPPDDSIETGLSTTNCVCACNHANDSNFASDVSGQCRTVARKSLKRPMSGIFEPSFESPIFGTTSSSTQTSSIDTNSSSLHPNTNTNPNSNPVDGVVSTKFIKMDDNSDSSRDSSNATISLENPLVYSNSLLTLTGVDFVSASSDYCDYVSKPLSSDFVSETHRNDDADDNSSSRSDSLSSQFSSSSLPLEDPSEDGNHTSMTPLPLSDTAQTPDDFVLGGMTLLDGKIVRFVELNGHRHFLLTDINSSWTLSAIIDSLLETEIVVHRCTPSERRFVLNLNQTLPQANADEMLLIADESFPRLKMFLSLTPRDNLCHTPPAEYSTPEPEEQMQYDNESQSEQNHGFTDEHS